MSAFLSSDDGDIMAPATDSETELTHNPPGDVSARLGPRDTSLVARANLDIVRCGRGKTSGLELEEQSVANLFHLRGDKVTRVVVYLDREQAFADLGLPPESREADAPDNGSPGDG
jgi:hypothetical protein